MTTIVLQLVVCLAEMLDLPYVSLATKFDLNGSTATVNREIEGGEEVCEVSLPVSCELPERCCRATYS